METNGNQDRKAMGMNTIAPMNTSYSLAIARTNFHKRSFFITGFNAIAICCHSKKIQAVSIRSLYLNLDLSETLVDENTALDVKTTKNTKKSAENSLGKSEEILTDRRPQPVGISDNTLANTSPIVRLVKATVKIKPQMTPQNTTN